MIQRSTSVYPACKVTIIRQEYFSSIFELFQDKRCCACFITAAPAGVDGFIMDTFPRTANAPKRVPAKENFFFEPKHLGCVTSEKGWLNSNRLNQIEYQIIDREAIFLKFQCAYQILITAILYYIYCCILYCVLLS